MPPVPEFIPSVSAARPANPPWRAWLLLAALAFLPSGPVRGEALAGADARGESAQHPEGTIERRNVGFEAPDAACESYLDNFRTRVWHVNVPSAAAFGRMLATLPLAEARRQALLDPTWWSPNPAGGFTVRPGAAFLRGLLPAERATLFALLARWEANKPERWPVHFDHPAALALLDAPRYPPDFRTRVEALAYPFAGGLAFSDFSLLAEEFPDRALLVRFLRESSATTGIIPRLKLRNALSVASALAYWTVDNNNAFARPLLEALLHTETGAGIELTALLPGAARVLAHEIEPEQIRYDASLRSFMISVSLTGGPQNFASAGEFRAWFDRHLERVEPPYRFGDLLVLDRPQGLPVRYACAYVADDIVFAKDPIALGLWRFMRPGDLLARNPHFAGGTWSAYRRRPDTPAPAQASMLFVTGNPGPWGVLRTAPLSLEPPDRWLDVVNLSRAQQWIFRGPGWARIEALLRRSQLTAPQLDFLLNPAIRRAGPDGSFVLDVPAALRLELSASSREILYAELGSLAANSAHYLPVVLPENDRDLAATGLSAAVIEVLQRVSYRRQGRRCVSDPDLLEAVTGDPAEARRLKRLLFAAPALLVELTRETLAYRAEAVEYWRKSDGRNADALLRWFDHSPDLEAIDLANFLPPLPRQTQNTFPESVSSDRTNCYWTSLNFFAREPDDRFLSSRLNQPGGQQVIAEELRRNYRPVEPPYRFGDVLCLADERAGGDGLIHMMNYIADGIVLTKNGSSALAPTVFMRLADVTWRYPLAFDLRLRAFRRSDRMTGN